MSAADEGSWLPCGPVTPGMQSAGAELAPGSTGEHLRPQHHLHHPKHYIDHTHMADHPHPQGVPSAHLKQLRWNSRPSTRKRCTKCTTSPQTPQVLLMELPMTRLYRQGESQTAAPRPHDPCTRLFAHCAHWVLGPGGPLQLCSDSRGRPNTSSSTLGRAGREGIALSLLFTPPPPQQLGKSREWDWFQKD